MQGVDLCNAIGYAAAAATLMTFAQRRMLPMRLSAIAANLLFMTYGLLGAFYPVFLLHLVLLPLNLLRLHQERSISAASLMEQWRLSRS